MDIFIFVGECVIQYKPNTKVHDKPSLMLDRTSFLSAEVEKSMILIYEDVLAELTTKFQPSMNTLNDYVRTEEPM